MTTASEQYKPGSGELQVSIILARYPWDHNAGALAEHPPLPQTSTETRRWIVNLLAKNIRYQLDRILPKSTPRPPQNTQVSPIFRPDESTTPDAVIIGPCFTSNGTARPAGSSLEQVRQEIGTSRQGRAQAIRWGGRQRRNRKHTVLLQKYGELVCLGAIAELCPLFRSWFTLLLPHRRSRRPAALQIVNKARRQGSRRPKIFRGCLNDGRLV